MNIILRNVFHHVPLACFIAAVCAILFTRPASAETPPDGGPLKGVWQIVVFQDDGRDRLARLGAGPPRKKDTAPRIAKLVFSATDCFLIRGDGRREMASGLTNAGWKSYQLDPSTTPWSIDIEGFAGKDSAKTRTYRGIYEIDGDLLRICYAESGSKRPTKFESDGNNNLFQCKRISHEPVAAPSPTSQPNSKK